MTRSSRSVFNFANSQRTACCHLPTAYCIIPPPNKLRKGNHERMTTTEGGANAARVADIQAALRGAGLDGWLFYDFRQSDPLAYRILKLDPKQFSTRRWFYFVPAEGEPTRINHAIEQGKLDALPGRKLIYSSWQKLNENLRDALSTANGSRVAMQYSP